MKTKKNILLLGLSVVFLTGAIVETTVRAEGPPVVKSLRKQEGKTAGHKTTGLLSNVRKNLPSKQSVLLKKVLRSTELPKTYIPKTTPVRNQGDLGICWAYSGSDLLNESSLNKLNLNTSFSPNYYNYMAAANAFLNDVINPTAIMLDENTPRPLDEGGPLDYVGTMTMLGAMPVLESTFKTPQSSSETNPILKGTYDNFSTSPIEVKSVIELSGPAINTSQLPTTAEINTRVNVLKQALYTYGSVQFGIYAENCLNDGASDPTYADKLWNASTSSSYIPITTTDLNKNGSIDGDEYYLNEDHAVVIVGWDDNYSKTNFKQQPSENGAFIVKNSWGTDWGNQGFYYVSYEDLYVYASDALAIDVGSMATNQNQYSYVNTSENNYFAFSAATPYPIYDNAYVANVFTSPASSNIQETLNAVSFYTNQAGVTVNVLYAPVAIKQTNTKDTTTKFTTLVSNYTLGESGFQKIPIPATKQLTLPENTSFTIAVQIVNASSFSTYALPFQQVSDTPSTGYPIQPAGKSFLSNEQSGNPQWINTSTSSAYQANFYVNAYTAVKYKEKDSIRINFSSLPKIYQGDNFDLISWIKARVSSSDGEEIDVSVSSYNNLTVGDKEITFTLKTPSGTVITEKRTLTVQPLLTLSTKYYTTSVGGKIAGISTAKNNKTGRSLVSSVKASGMTTDKTGTYKATYKLSAKNGGHTFTVTKTGKVKVEAGLSSIQKNTTIYNGGSKLPGKSKGNAKKNNVYQETVQVRQLVKKGTKTYAKIYKRSKEGGSFNKFVGYILKSSLSNKNVLKSNVSYTKKNVAVTSKTATLYNKPYVKGAKKLRSIKSYHSKKVTIKRKAVVDKTTYYKIYYKNKYIGWVNSSALKK